MSALTKFLIGLVLLAFLGIVGIYLGWLPHGSAKSAETKLQEAASTALKEQGLGWAIVTMDGQKGVLEGIAPTRESIETAREAVRHSVWSGGLVGGGVTVVRDDGTRFAEMKKEPSAPLADPYIWGARLDDIGLTLTGYVPDDEIRAALLAEAEKLFPGKVTDETQIARGVPEGNWQAAALRNLRALQALDSGGIKATGTEFRLWGEAANPSAMDRVTARLGDFVSGFQSFVEVDVPEQVSNARTTGSAINDLANIAVVEATEEQRDICQDQFNLVMKDSTINFELGSARILPESRPVLNRLAAVAGRCAAFEIEIAGHTDSSGSAASNMRLSEARAASVRAYLERRGVPGGQIVAKGYGETSPLVPNNSPSNQAKNRRIEFTVHKSGGKEGTTGD